MPTSSKNFVTYGTRSERVAHVILNDAKRGNRDLASAVEAHATGLNRGELLAVLRLVFEQLADRYAEQDQVRKRVLQMEQ
jgi:hypothetical protein